MELDSFVSDAERRGFKIDSSSFKNEGILIASTDNISITRFIENNKMKINIDFIGQTLDAYELHDYIDELQKANLIAFVMENVKK